tara:strand:+ start:186 stop:665 length:480 start_codon:yes stop_codon:yes gene_type:complete
MNTEFDKFLVELKIINNIPINGKLIIENNCLIIDHNTWLSTLYRKWNNHSRKNSIAYLKLLYFNVFELVDKWMNNNILNPNKKLDSRDYILFFNLKNNLVYLKDALFSSKIGLKNLIGTYNDDLEMVKDLSSLIIQINDKYEKMCKCIQSNSNKTVTKN